MACLLVPATVAVVTTSVRKKVPAKYHLEWLNAMLWGGVIMLLVEHIAHREIVLYPPFLTAMQNPNDVPVMLKEMVTIGLPMTLTIVLVWLVMVLIAKKMSKATKIQIEPI